MSSIKSNYVTSYDVLKTIAVVLMILDHVGFYVLPEVEFLRVLGRLCVPIWFFLIGYANTREIIKDLWSGALVLTISSLIMGGSVFPITILLSFIIIRLVLDYVAEYGFKSKENFIILCFVMVILWFPSSFIMEYGTAGLGLTLVGYTVRHNNSYRIKAFLAFFLLFTLSQIFVFQFDFIHSAFMTFGLTIVGLALWRFKPMDYVGFNSASIIGHILKFTGRHTLFIYVAHILILKALAASFQIGDLGWFLPVKFF
jgi:hypothetical protein